MKLKGRSRCILTVDGCAVLRIAPQDTDALQTKLFLLLQKDQYGAALSLIDGATSGSSSKYIFEKAYSLYRLQRESEVAEAINAIKLEGGEDMRGVMHLEAQVVRTRLHAFVS